MIRNTAGQKIGAQMVNSGTGTGFTGTVTVYVTGDGGVQAIGEVGAGLCTNEGNGYFTYSPSQAETAFDLIAFTFFGLSAIPVTVQVETVTLTQMAALQSASSPTVVTVRDLLTLALEDLGVLAVGEVMDSDMGSLGLSTLNDWIDSLKNEGLTVYTLTRSTWTIVANTASYTVGPGGDVDIERPVNAQSIESIGFQDTSMNPILEFARGPCLTEDQYAGIAQKAITSTYPNRWYYNPTWSAGLGTLTPWPIPTSTSLQGVIYAPAPVGEFVSLNSAISQPPGYRRFYRTNVAMELADAFDAPPTPAMQRRAAESKADIKRANTRLMDMQIEYPGRRPWYNIFTGP